MKNLIRNILLFMVLATASLQAMAFSLPHDTVYFYNTWEQLLIDSPATMYVDPWIDPITPYEVIIETPNEKYNDAIWNKHIAAVLGDSIWLINSEYLQREFKGDAKKDGMVLSETELKGIVEAFEHDVEFHKSKIEENSQYDGEKRYLLGGECRVVMSHKCGIGWSSGAHTAMPVLTTAKGRCAEKFSGFIENTDIAKAMKAFYE